MVKSLCFFLFLCFTALFPGNALSECAWVLWIKEHSVLPTDKDLSSLKESVTWEIHSAVETRKECLVNQEALYKVVANGIVGGDGLEKSEKRFPIGLFRTFKGGGFWHTTVHCFPESVNPGKK